MQQAFLNAMKSLFPANATGMGGEAGSGMPPIPRHVATPHVTTPQARADMVDRQNAGAMAENARIRNEAMPLTQSVHGGTASAARDIVDSSNRHRAVMQMNAGQRPDASQLSARDQRRAAELGMSGQMDWSNLIPPERFRNGQPAAPAAPRVDAAMAAKAATDAGLTVDPATGQMSGGRSLTSAAALAGEQQNALRRMEATTNSDGTARNAQPGQARGETAEQFSARQTAIRERMADRAGRQQDAADLARMSRTLGLSREPTESRYGTGPSEHAAFAISQLAQEMTGNAAPQGANPNSAALPGEGGGLYTPPRTTAQTFRSAEDFKALGADPLHNDIVQLSNGTHIRFDQNLGKWAAVTYDPKSQRWGLSPTKPTPSR